MNIEEYVIYDWSIGGLETCIVIKGRGIALGFDVGVARTELLYCDFIFVTHGHPDHCAALPNAISKRYVANKSFSNIKSTTKVIAPMFLKSGIDDLINRAFSNGYMSPGVYFLETSRLSSSLEVFGGFPRWRYRCIRSTHSIPCYGYQVYYDGQPEIAYTGDTSISFLFLPENKDVLKTRILIMEVSGWDVDDPADIEKAHNAGHVHIKDFLDNQELFSDIQHIVMFHLRPKYSLDFIEKTRLLLPESLRAKTHICLTALKHFHEVEERWKKEDD